MGFDWLGFGFVGALEAAMLAAGVGCVLFGIAHALRGVVAWRQGMEIGVAFGIALLISAGADASDPFYLGIVKFESPFAIQQTLAQIHDPDSLGPRVVFEFIGVSCLAGCCGTHATESGSRVVSTAHRLWRIRHVSRSSPSWR